MECPKCKKEVNELDETYPRCGLVFEEYENELKEKKKNEETDMPGDKTAFLKFINVLQLIGFIIMMFIQMNNEEQLKGMISIATGIVLFAFIKGFINIIDLLDEINRKIDKK